MMTGLQKSQKMESQTSPGHLNDLQNVGAKVGHQHHETSALNKIQNMVLMKKKKKEKK